MSLNVRPHLLQMLPLPELVLSSTTVQAIPRFASYNSGRAGRSVAPAKMLSVRRRFQTEATAFTLCTAVGTAKEQKAGTASPSQPPLPPRKVGSIPTGSGIRSGTPTLGHPLKARKMAGKKAGATGGISDQPRFGSAVKIQNRQPELRTAPLPFVPALQDLGTASPLQTQKRSQLPTIRALLSPLMRSLSQSFTNLAPALPRLEQRFCSAGAGLFRYLERCPKLIPDPACYVSLIHTTCPLSGASLFEAGWTFISVTCSFSCPFRYLWLLSFSP